MKHSIKFTAIIAAYLFTATHAMAQEAKLTLQQAIDMGIKNSKNLKISNAKIDEAVAVVKEANDNRMPNLNASSSYLHLSGANVDLKTGSSNGQNGNTPNISQAVYGIVNLSMPLYAGGKIKYGIESAKLLEQATRLDADKDLESVIYNITKAYVNLYKAAGTVGLVKENLQSSLARDTNFSNLEKNGLLARNDLLKAQLQTSTIELSLLDAENNYKLAEVNMNLMLGQPENTFLDLDSSFINEKPTLKSFSEYETMALQNRKDIRAISFRIKAANTAIKIAKAEAYPVIALTGGYIAAYIPNFISITNAINVGIGIQYNIASLWKTNTKLIQAKARQQEVTANEAILDDGVKLEVNQDYQNYLLNMKKIDVYEHALIQATENLRITNNKYNNNLLTITDLLDADVITLQAKLNIAAAKADAVLAYQKLLQTTGSIK